MTLEISDLSVVFDATPGTSAGPTVAVDRLSLTVAAGEIVAIVGPSGCGKSTLLRTVAGLQEPTSGSLLWNGADLNSVPVHKRGFGLMFQSHALFAHRTVEENIAFGLRMAGRSRTEQNERVRELLEMVELPGTQTRPVTELSGGEAQRVALARALAPEPSVLLLDEPLGALDRRLRSDLAEQLRSVLRELGQTTLHVTHDLDEAFDIADRVAVMHAGQIRRIGEPSEIWDDPQSAFVARFIGHRVIEVDRQPLIVRPGDAAIANTPESTSQELMVSAVVTDVRFRPPHNEVTCTDSSGNAWTILENRDGTPPAIGQDVRITFDPSQLPLATRE